MTAVTTRRQGRPRLSGPADSGLPAAEQILEAAARLFVEDGYQATSTRAVAAAVGIRQASLYYHFASKADLLAELLARSVRPSLEAADALLADLPDDDPVAAAARLHALVLADAELLLGTPHNTGALYLLPEIRDERFAAFREERRRLRDAYGRLVAAARPPAGHPAGTEALTDMVLGLVESVIGIRGEGGGADLSALPGAVAEACLRVVGWPDSAAVLAARQPAAARP